MATSTKKLPRRCTPPRPANSCPTGTSKAPAPIAATSGRGATNATIATPCLRVPPNCSTRAVRQTTAPSRCATRSISSLICPSWPTTTSRSGFRRAKRIGSRMSSTSPKIGFWTRVSSAVLSPATLPSGAFPCPCRATNTKRSMSGSRRSLAIFRPLSSGPTTTANPRRGRSGGTTTRPKLSTSSAKTTSPSTPFFGLPNCGALARSTAPTPAKRTSTCPMMCPPTSL